MKTTFYTYYAGLIKKTNDLEVSKQKTDIARHLNLHEDTIARRLKRTNSYDDDYCSIWIINIPPLKRGFGR